MIWAILGIPFSAAILITWYFQTYTDSQYGDVSRAIGSAMHNNSKSNSVGFPATGIVFLLFSIAIIFNELKGPRLIITTLMITAIACTVIALVWRFSPLPVPRWADARYQYMKRHGMLDKNDDPLPQFEVPEDAKDPTTNDHSEDTL